MAKKKQKDKKELTTITLGEFDTAVIFRTVEGGEAVEIAVPEYEDVDPNDKIPENLFNTFMYALSTAVLFQENNKEFLKIIASKIEEINKKANELEESGE